MNSLIVSDQCSLIIGAGSTGRSIARFLERKGHAFFVFDTREDTALASPFAEFSLCRECYLGELPEHIIDAVNAAYISPGVSKEENAVLQLLARNIPVRSDISLFLSANDKPVVGITGSNGKSTVTTLFGLVAEQAGIPVAVGGNLGRPALDLLDESVELYVLELSSFQLESTDAAGLAVAVHLNVSADHLDRHGSMSAYFQAKQKIFHGASSVVFNLHDPLTQPPIVAGVNRWGFGIDRKIETHEIQFHLNDDRTNIMRNGEALFARADIRQAGLHNVENVLAVLAIAEAVAIPVSCVEQVVQSFTGLAHRCEFVGEVNGVTFINDSKATNAGATLAALQGLAGEAKRIYLIAGGEAKGADLHTLSKEIIRLVAGVILIGRDADRFSRLFDDRISWKKVSSMAEAVDSVVENTRPGDLVLLSPACASFDMFTSFEHRGDVFKQCVQELVA